MTNTKANRRASVDSLYVSCSTRDQVRVQTYFNFGDEASLAPHGGCNWIGCNTCNRGDFYVISVNGRRVLETRSKAVVRDYLTENDCRAVASFKE